MIKLVKYIHQITVSIVHRNIHHATTPRIGVGAIHMNQCRRWLFDRFGRRQLYRSIYTIDNRLVNYMKSIETQLMGAESRIDIGQHRHMCELWSTMRTKLAELAELQSMAAKGVEDRALDEMIAVDVHTLSTDIGRLESQLESLIVGVDEFDRLTRCQIEVLSGAGGTEAMLFANDIVLMYQRYAQYRQWHCEPLRMESIDLTGGIRCALLAVEGANVFRDLKFEGGVHRVQRFPATDPSRLHTSTVSVAIMPEPENIDVIVKSTDLTIEAMRSSGPGGQKVNTSSSKARVLHKPSGIAVHCMEQRTLKDNIQTAIKRIAAILYDQQISEAFAKHNSQRRLQIGTRTRTEKIRTYNYQQNRVTDHRTKHNYSMIESVLRGDDALQQIIDDLATFNRKERLAEIIDQR